VPRSMPITFAIYLSLGGSARPEAPPEPPFLMGPSRKPRGYIWIAGRCCNVRLACPPAVCGLIDGFSRRLAQGVASQNLPGHSGGRAGFRSSTRRSRHAASWLAVRCESAHAIGSSDGPSPLESRPRKVDAEGWWLWTGKDRAIRIRRWFHPISVAGDGPAWANARQSAGFAAKKTDTSSAFDSSVIRNQ
jgi:hypothetical protein